MTPKSLAPEHQTTSGAVMFDAGAFWIDAFDISSWFFDDEPEPEPEPEHGGSGHFIVARKEDETMRLVMLFFGAEQIAAAPLAKA